jgi:hypothetical protein
MLSAATICSPVLLGEVESRIWALGAQKLRFMVGKEKTSAHEFYSWMRFDFDKDISISKLRPESPRRDK